MNTFWFNGEAMHQSIPFLVSVNYGPFLNNWRDEWEETVGYERVRHLLYRWDHESVESEDVNVFTFCILVLIRTHLNFGPDIVNKVNRSDWTHLDAPPNFEGIVPALASMIHIANRDGVAVWINGGAEEKSMLEKRIQQSKLSPSDEGFAELPHIRRERNELRRRIEIERDRVERLGLDLHDLEV